MVTRIPGGLGAVVVLNGGEAFAPDLLTHHEAASQPAMKRKGMEI